MMNEDLEILINVDAWILVYYYRNLLQNKLNLMKERMTWYEEAKKRFICFDLVYQL